MPSPPVLHGAMSYLMQIISRTWLLTWTTKGTWLPGDKRGWVKGDRDNQSGLFHEFPSEGLRVWSLQQMTGKPVWLNKEQAGQVLASFLETANIQAWWIGAIAVMANHVHLVVTVGGDPEPGLLIRRFKNFCSRSLNIYWGKQDWWTASGSNRQLSDQNAINAAMQYVIEQFEALAIYQSQNPGLQSP